jgi:hypothetical protein
VQASGARFPLALLALAVLGVLFGTTAARLFGAVLLVSSVLLLSSLVRDVRAQEDVLDGLAMSATDRRVPFWRRARSSDRITQKLTLGEYRELLAGVAAPSREQLEAFARFVATAHSWYKHLWLLPPGHAMTFFLDPGAGGQLIVDRRGWMRQYDRLEHGFHYSWPPTAVYRDRFGHAAFAQTAGPGREVSLVLMDGWQLVPSDGEPAIFDPNRGELVALPDEVVEAGTAYLSGVVHPRACYPVLWRRVTDWDASRGDWPAESGGAAVFAEIRERVRALMADPHLIEPPPDPPPNHYLGGCDFVLYRLLAAERRRQQGGVVAALERVVDLVR